MPEMNASFESQLDLESPGYQGSQVVLLWCSRIIIPLQGYRQMICNHGFDRDNLWIAMGAGQYLKFDDFSAPKDRALKALRLRHKQLEQKSEELSLPTILASNLERLSDSIRLNEAERRLLAFAVLLNNEPLLKEALHLLDNHSTEEHPRILATVLDLETQEVSKALRFDAPLVRSGLLAGHHHRFCSDLADRLSFVSSGFAESMQLLDEQPISFLRDLLLTSPSPHLEMDDFSHLGHRLALLTTVLSQALTCRQQGVNILFYGPPGTGKTQLSRLLARHLQTPLYEISTENEEGSASRGSERMRAYSLAQSFLARQSCLLMFDDLDDVYERGFMGFGSQGDVHKGWMNLQLERNLVPTFWITNDPDGLDPAIVRRFTMTLALDVPPRAQRLRIAAKLGEGLLDENLQKHLASAPQLSPASLAMASQVWRQYHAGDVSPLPDKELIAMIDDNLQAQGLPALPPREGRRLPDGYDPCLLNLSHDPAMIANGLEHSGRGRLCLYGESGTGKTAYVHWLAGRLDRPLLSCNAASLLSSRLGGTEFNIQQLFRQAEDSESLLFIDEADSFLCQRQRAQYNWEYSMINTLLLHLEQFQGILVVATNLPEILDPAALRRFDIKLAFRPLNEEQAWALLVMTSRRLGLQAPGPAQREWLGEMEGLTLGHFKLVQRRHEFLPFRSVEDLVASLMEEARFKQNLVAPQALH